VTDFDIPYVGSARVHLLHEGHAGFDGDDERVSGTVTLIIPGHGAPFRPSVHA